MLRQKVLRTSCVYAMPVPYLVAVAIAGAPSADEGQSQDGELQMGEEVFNELKAQGELIECSPLYDQLRPISDHTNDQHRADALEQHFSDNPSVFGEFGSDPKSAKPFSVSKGAPEVFLHGCSAG